MQLLDFSNEPFVSVCEKDTSFIYNLTGTVSSTAEINECRNPFLDFSAFTILIICFVFIVYKVSCMVGD
jgi:hypothetical protein